MRPRKLRVTPAMALAFTMVDLVDGLERGRVELVLQLFERALDEHITVGGDHTGVITASRKSKGSVGLSSVCNVIGLA